MPSLRVKPAPLCQTPRPMHRRLLLELLERHLTARPGDRAVVGR